MLIKWPLPREGTKAIDEVLQSEWLLKHELCPTREGCDFTQVRVSRKKNACGNPGSAFFEPLNELNSVPIPYGFVADDGVNFKLGHLFECTTDGVRAVWGKPHVGNMFAQKLSHVGIAVDD
ncbi:MAG: hypothetical protein KGP28_02500 [Bdellovibrionales bacterium]|nr:hypothetical protein [Bdellovibrionales bacterium]